MAHVPLPFTPSTDPGMLDAQFSYVRGYIIALEDVLSDLDGTTVHLIPPCDFLVARTHDNIRAKVQMTLDRANLTLQTLERLQDERTHYVGQEQGQQGSDGAVLSSPGEH